MLIRLPIAIKGKSFNICDDECPHLNKMEGKCRLYGKLNVTKNGIMREEACFDHEDANYHFSVLYDKVNG